MADSLPPVRSDRLPGDGADIDTTPNVPRPPNEFLDSAARAIPTILADVQPTIVGLIELVASELVSRIRSANHTLAAAQWALHESVLAGRLMPGLGETEAPTTGRRVGGAMRRVVGPDNRRIEWKRGNRLKVLVPNGKPAPFENFNVIATENLWN